MQSSRPELPTACWRTSSGTGLPSWRRISVSMSGVPEPAYGGRFRLIASGLPNAPAPSPVSRTTLGVQAT